MKKVLCFALTLAMGLTFLSVTLNAGEEGEKGVKKIGSPRFFGKVEVVREGDEVKEIFLVFKDQKIPVALDEKGKELAAMEGKNVVVKGDKDENGVVTVKEFMKKEPKLHKEEKKKEKSQEQNQEQKQEQEGKSEE